MASDKPARQTPAVGTKVSRWGVNFTWTPEHPSWEDLEPLQRGYDKSASAAYERLVAIRDARAATADPNQQALPPQCKSKDLFALLRDKHSTDPILGQFWEEAHHVPDWVDWQQIERGQRVFYRYIGGNLFSFYGLTIGTAAIPDIAEVLARTGGSSTKALLPRSFETLSWLLMVTQSLEAVQPGGTGHTMTIRVRLLHAAVRDRIRKLTATRPSYFNEAEWGVPVSDLGSLYTILIFGGGPPWMSLACSGVHPSAREVADHVALHRYVGYVMGAPTERYFDSPAQSKAALEACFYFMLRPTASSRVFMYNFVESMVDLPSTNLSKPFLEAATRWVNGTAISDACGIGKPPPYYYALLVGHYMLCWTLSWLQWAIPALDEWIIQYSRHGLLHWCENVVLKGRPTFKYKYVPNHGKATVPEDGKVTTAEKKRKAAGLKPPPTDRWIERAYLRILLFGCVVVALGGYGAVHLVAMACAKLPASGVLLSALVVRSS